MASTALGLTRPEGREPALEASTFPPPCMRANASAIWLRFEFSTHTKTTRFTSNPPGSPSGGSSTQAQQFVDDPAAGRVRGARAAVSQDDRVGTAGLLQGVGEDRQPVPRPFVANRPGQPGDGAVLPRKPGGVDVDGVHR